MLVNEVVIKSDIPADDEIVRTHRRCRGGAADIPRHPQPRGNGKMPQHQTYRYGCLIYSGKRQRRYHLCQIRARYQSHRYPGLWRLKGVAQNMLGKRAGTLLPGHRRTESGRIEVREITVLKAGIIGLGQSQAA